MNPDTDKPSQMSENDTLSEDSTEFFSPLCVNADTSCACSLDTSESTASTKLALSLLTQTRKTCSCIRVKDPSVNEACNESSSVCDDGDDDRTIEEEGSPQLEQNSLSLKNQPADLLESEMSKLGKQRHLDVQTPGECTKTSLACISHSSKHENKHLGNNFPPQFNMHAGNGKNRLTTEAFEGMRWYEIPLSSLRKHKSGLLSQEVQSSLREYRELREKKKKKNNQDSLLPYRLTTPLVLLERLRPEHIELESNCESWKDGDMNRTDSTSPSQEGKSFSTVLTKQLSHPERAFEDCLMPPLQRYPYCPKSCSSARPISQLKRHVTPYKRATKSHQSFRDAKKQRKELVIAPAPIQSLNYLREDCHDPQTQGQPQLPSSDSHLDDDIRNSSTSDSMLTVMDYIGSSESQISDSSDCIFATDIIHPRIDFLYRKLLPVSLPSTPGVHVKLEEASDFVMAGMIESVEQIVAHPDCAHFNSNGEMVLLVGALPTPAESESNSDKEINVLEEIVPEDCKVDERSQNSDQICNPCQGVIGSVGCGSADPDPVNKVKESSSMALVRMLQEQSMAVPSNPISEPPNNPIAEPPSNPISEDPNNPSSEDYNLLGFESENPTIDSDSKDDGEDLVKLADLFPPASSTEVAALQPSSPVNAELKGSCSVSASNSSPEHLFIAPIAIVPAPEDYINSLEYLLQEKLLWEHAVLEEELEKSLKESKNLRKGFDGPPASDTSENEEPLTEEHRLIIQKYTLSSEVIPCSHPGEDVFTEPQNIYLPNPRSSFILDTAYLPSQDFLESMLFSSRLPQQISFIRDGFLRLLYRNIPCPEAVLSWLFQLLAAPPEVSMDSFKALWDISLERLLKPDGVTGHMWCPKLPEIVMLFQNLGFRPSALPHGILPGNQTTRNCCILLHENHDPRSTGCKDTNTESAVSETALATNLSHVCKFLTLCGVARPLYYTDCDLLTLVSMLCKASLDRALRCQPFEDLRQLLATFLDNIRLWDEKLPELCVSLSQLSQHHHNLLRIVQNIPNVTDRGRQLQRRLSLVNIAKALGMTEKVKFCKEDVLLPTLCRLFSSMNPSSLKSHLEQVRQEYMPSLTEEQMKQPYDIDREVCYLCHSLLMLANVVVGSEAIPSDNWNSLHALCLQLDRQITSNVRETPQLMYRSTLKDLAVRTSVKWQELLAQGRPPQLYPCSCVIPLQNLEFPRVGIAVPRSKEGHVANHRQRGIEAEDEAPGCGRVVNDNAVTGMPDQGEVETEMNGDTSSEEKNLTVCEGK